MTSGREPVGPHGLFVGHTTHDRFGGATVAGGSAWYAARAWRGLGGGASLVTVVGEDFRADGAFEGLAAHVARAGRTTVFHNRYDAPPDGPGRDRVQWIEAVAPPVGPDRLPAAARGADVAFLAPVFGEVDLAAWKAATGARRVAIGVQGWIKEAGPIVGEPDSGEPGGGGPGGGAARRVVARPWRPAAAALDGIDVAVLSDDDLRGQDDLLSRLRAAVPVVALTHGRAGATVFEGRRRTAIDAWPTTEVDPTGAGDTFAAGFLYGLAEGRPAVEAARLGAATASVVVEAQGGAALDRVAEAFERVAGVRVRGADVTRRDRAPVTPS